jgi:hypothetical protein
MNLDEAVAGYAVERDSLLDELHPDAKDYPDTSISWHRERDKRALDAAVRDVALAAGKMASPSCPDNCALCAETWRAEIERRFGKVTDVTDSKGADK